MRSDSRGSALSFYHALVIAVDTDARCGVLLAEDTQHGRKFDGVTVQSTFS